MWDRIATHSDVSRVHLNQNYMTAMENINPNSASQQPYFRRHSWEPEWELCLRLWEELETNKQQGHAERHDGLRLWNQKNLGCGPQVSLLTSLCLLSSSWVKSSLARVSRRFERRWEKYLEEELTHWRPPTNVNYYYCYYGASKYFNRLDFFFKAQNSIPSKKTSLLITH